MTTVTINSSSVWSKCWIFLKLIKMEALRQSQDLYVQFHQKSLAEPVKIKVAKDIQRFIGIALREVTCDKLFTNPLVYEILTSTLKQKAVEISDVMSVERAFWNLEKYIYLLVEQPWKPEFREIKMYGGFYRTKVKSVIPDCEYIFQQAGYRVIPDRCTMICTDCVDKNSLLFLAFDCKVSQMVCFLIVDHYSKVKGLSLTLKDVVSEILQEERSRGEKSVFRHCEYFKNVLTSSNSAPPEVPRRERILNGSAIRGNVVSDNALYFIRDKHEPGLMNRLHGNINAHVNAHQNTYNSSALSNLPQIPSHAIVTSFEYIDTQADEIIPELPQGTCDEHIQETLKLVNLQDTQRQHVPKHKKQQIKHVSPSDYSLVSTSIPLFHGANSEAINTQSNFKNQPRIDEGIDIDSKVFSLSTKFNSTHGKHLRPNKQSINNQQISFDQGYPESIPSQCSTNLFHDSQQTIYHPPNITVAGSGHTMYVKPLLSRKNALPIPIWTEPLENIQLYEEDSIHCDNTHIPALNVANKYNVQTQSISAHPPVSAPGSFDYSKKFDMDQYLNRNQSAVIKSSSLKNIETSKSLPPHIPLSRMAKSMDKLKWTCPVCITQNMASDKTCSKCSNSYLGMATSTDSVY